MGREKCEGLMRAAYERGIRRFDLADIYGTHPFVISALENIPRKDFTIISKIWFRPDGIPEKERPDADVCVERFLKEITPITSTSFCSTASNPADGPKNFRNKWISSRS